MFKVFSPNYSRRVMMLMSLLMFAVLAFAVPAKPGLTRLLTLSNGSTVMATLVGDEHGHYWQGTDGKNYQLISGTTTYQEVNSQEVIQRAQQRRAQANQRRVRRMAPQRVGNVGSITGDKKGIIILVNFKDDSFTATQDDFYKLANQQNYNSGNYKGSMYDYFYAQSEGQFRLTFDVVGPYTVSNNCSYYGGNDSSGNDSHPAEMVIEALKLADQDVNYADYDWDRDGEVEQVYVVYAGKGEADGGADETIWPHEWTLSSAGYYGDGAGAQTLDGVKIDTYACGGEQNGSTGKTAGIGTMCHEFSHCLGYPDFYDTDYSGGQGMGYWDLMDSGSYNGNGYQPAGYTSYERWVAGWKTPTELVNTQTISNMAALQNGGSSYIIYNKANNNEYYLLENRQKTVWDSSLPGAGLLILHVDYDATAWNNNQPNDAPSHQRMTWIPADNKYQYETSNGSKYYTTDGMKNDPFPYGTVNAFGKSTTPAASLYNNNSDGTKYLDSSVENITQNADGTISFDFVGANDQVDPTPSGTTLLYEGLSDYSGQDGTFEISKTYQYLDYKNWSSLSKIYAGSSSDAQNNGGCLKFGSGSAVGSMTSGSISLTGTGTLTFYLKKYGSDTGKLNVTVTGATADKTQFTPADDWTLCTVNLTNATGAVTLTLATSTKRAYVDEITLSAASTPAVTTPELITEPETLTFEAEANASQTKTFDVLGADLTGDVTVSLTDANHVFSVSSTTISKSDAEEGAKVSVTFTPTAAGSYTGSVTLSSAGAEAVTVALSATATASTTPDEPTSGTKNNPYTVEEARAAIDAGTGTQGVYATGIVSQIVTAYNSQYGNITYNISSNGLTTGDQLQAYRGKSYNGDNFTSADDIQVGDVVVIYGNLTKYNSTYEFAQNNQLVSLVRKSSYYAPADGKKGEELKTAMCGIIYNRTEKSYDYLWTAFQTTDVRSDGKIWDMYSKITNYEPVTSGSSYSKEGDCYNREHSWPQSWFNSNTPMYTDLHHIYPTDGFVNGKRANYPFGETNNPTYSSANGFSKLGPCSYSGYTGTVFEPADEYKGDFARTYFYMVTCYEEKLADWYAGNADGIRATIDGSTYPGLQEWQLNMLMEWAKNDPVSEKEINRNNAVYAIQKNRNPFIDYPGLQEYIWGICINDAFDYDNYVTPVYKQNVTMAFNPTEVTATIGEDFTEPTLTTTPANLTVTYSSSEQTVATINVATGEVTPVAAGTTVITATFAGDNSYNSGSATYTLTVSEATTPDPVVGSGTYALVTDASTLAAGDKILIAYVNGTTKYVLSTTQNSNNRAATDDVTINNDGTLTPGEAAQVITLEKDGTNYLFNVGSGYLYAASSGSNWLRTEETADANAKATISINSNSGDATITFQGTYTRNVIRYNPNTGNNNGSPLFSCYASSSTTGTLPQIYREVPIPTITLANNSDNTSVIEANNGKLVNVTLADRTLWKDGDWNTICLPFDLSAEQIAESDLAGADIRALNSAEFNQGTLTLNFTPETGNGAVTSITAGTPYIVKWGEKSSNIVNPTFSGVTIDNTRHDKSCDLGEGKSITFCGTYNYREFEDADKSILFIGAKNTIYYPEAGAKIAAQRAYFQLKGITAADLPQSAIVLNFDAEGTTGLNSLTPALSQGEGVYTLDGRKLNAMPTQKGVYIVNGKKVVIK